MKPLLSVKDLKVNYGAINAVKGVSFDVFPGEVVSLIGSNGAGKTSILRALSGLAESNGEVLLDGASLLKIPPHQRVKYGLAQSPEGRGVFADMSVLENMELGAYHRSDKAEVAADMEKCFKFFPRMKERLHQISGTLSGGEQQMLAISRALMAKPKLLLLDEPSLGLAPLIVAQIFEIVSSLNKEGMTILIVEQNAMQALKISNRAYVLETGKIVLSDSAKNLLANDEIKKAYLGI